MKASEYRRQLDAELAAAEPTRPEKAEPADELLTEMTNRRFGVRRRAAAVQRAGARAVKRHRLMDTLIAMIADPEEHADVRRAALAAVEANTFKTVEFRRYAAEFNAALRAAATDDDAGLRLEVLDILALNKDSYAQELLVEGLRSPRQAKVPAVQAVRMLGYDLHAEHYPLLRDIVENKKQPQLRRAALRLLGADSGSAALMARIAADKSEDKAARTTAAMALQSLAPKQFARVARTVVLDDEEDDDLRATVISAISHGPAAPGRDITRKVREIDAARGGQRQLNRAARQFTAVQSRDSRNS